MSFAKEKRSILFTGYTAMGNGLTFEQFKEVATNAKEAGLTHVDLGSAMLDRSRWQLDNNGNYEPGCRSFQVPLPESIGKASSGRCDQSKS